MGHLFTRTIFGSRFPMWAVLFMIAGDFVLFVALSQVAPQQPMEGLARHIIIQNLTLFTGLPAFILTIMQMIRSFLVERSKFVMELLSRFDKEDGLRSAYYDLIYDYHDTLFQAIADAATTRETTAALVESTKHLQGQREPGRRFLPVDKRFFSGTPEERRLDAVLDYFNAVAFAFDQGLVLKDDLEGMLGPQLSVLCRRHFIESYVASCASEFVKHSRLDENSDWRWYRIDAYEDLQHLLEAMRREFFHLRPGDNPNDERKPDEHSK